MYGTVVFKSKNGDYFFVRSGQGADVFGHVSEVVGDRDSLQVGSRVEYALGERAGRPVARDVHIIEDADAEVAAVRTILGGAR